MIEEASVLSMDFRLAFESKWVLVRAGHFPLRKDSGHKRDAIQLLYLQLDCYLVGILDQTM